MMMMRRCPGRPRLDGDRGGARRPGDRDSLHHAGFQLVTQSGSLGRTYGSAERIDLDRVTRGHRKGEYG
jgi:hypothetical protein